MQELLKQILDEKTTEDVVRFNNILHSKMVMNNLCIGTKEKLLYYLFEKVTAQQKQLNTLNEQIGNLKFLVSELSKKGTK